MESFASGHAQFASVMPMALPRAAAWQLRARPHIPYNKPHLLKPNFKDLSSTFIYTVLESSAAGGSYFYNWRPTWKTPDPAFQAVRDFPMDGDPAQRPESRLECLANPHVGSRVRTCFCDIEVSSANGMMIGLILCTSWNGSSCLINRIRRRRRCLN
ncbi:hypothetical protein DUI87_03174 [Hirundo rustica rustica]|uniref:Uncharacterized protein n=1 Tax=Hirundo rustica rustica TaxID=333673 RepID=A0A3M0L6M3_HIRRU|nr:hypothetical protein DUI87_03174 [Hirundo rustica rustica]